MTLTLPIQAGKQYVRRDGNVVTARCNKSPQEDNLLLIGLEDEKPFKGEHYAYINSGKVCRYEKHPRDLVADYSPEKEHDYAEILRAISEGKEVEWFYDGRWRYQSPSITLQEIAKARYSPEYYRIKPEVVSINGDEVPEPCRKPLHFGVNYWYVNLDEFGLVKEETWMISHLDHIRLGLGIVHLTKEAASLHAEALLSFTKVN